MLVICARIACNSVVTGARSMGAAGVAGATGAAGAAGTVTVTLGAAALVCLRVKNQRSTPPPSKIKMRLEVFTKLSGLNRVASVSVHQATDFVQNARNILML